MDRHNDFTEILPSIRHDFPKPIKEVVFTAHVTHASRSAVA